MINSFKLNHPLPMLCNQLNVAVSAYCAYCNWKLASPRKQDLCLLTHIHAAHERRRGIYGSHKCESDLASQGVAVSINRIKRLRKTAGIRCIHKRKLRVTTDAKHKLPIAPNLFNREFTQCALNKVWVTDITSIPTNEGWLYLAAVKDLYTCVIVGWAMGEQMIKTLVCDVLRAAYLRKKQALGLMHHSDHGSQYCAETYRNMQVSYNMQTSMSRKGDCWDNAPTESFFGALKNRVFASPQI